MACSKGVNIDFGSKVMLEKVELWKAEDGKYYLNVDYILDNKRLTTRMHLHKIELPIDHNKYLIESTYSDGDLVDIGFGRCPVGSIYEEVIKEKTVEVTMEEIEKKFGCKVKIVKEK